MKKQKVIKAKYQFPQYPIGATVLTWLLYKQLNLSGVSKGVFLTLAIGMLSTSWIIALLRVFTVEGGDPVFKDEP